MQAGERTSHLFRLANYHDALVVGTGDLSELALGWCTYGVGDHMSHCPIFRQPDSISTRLEVGSGGSLSPRGDYRAPSDSEATVWLHQLELVTESE